MKIATYNDGSRDGQLVVVSRDLATAHYATGVAGRLQQVVDDWNFLAPQLEELGLSLNHGTARHAFEFDPRRCGAPLPRAYAWAEPAPGARPPRLQLGRSDALLASRTALPLPVEPPLGVTGIELRMQLALLTGDISAGAEAASALDGIRLLLLACSVHAVAEDNGCDGALAVACAPVALTPDEIGEAWRAGRAELALQLRRSGRRDSGAAEANAGASASALAPGELLQHAACWTGLRAGSLIGCGAADGAALRLDWPQTDERLRISATTADGEQPFGTLELTLGSVD